MTAQSATVADYLSGRATDDGRWEIWLQALLPLRKTARDAAHECRHLAPYAGLVAATVRDEREPDT